METREVLGGLTVVVFMVFGLLFHDVFDCCLRCCVVFCVSDCALRILLYGFLEF